MDRYNAVAGTWDAPGTAPDMPGGGRWCLGAAVVGGDGGSGSQQVWCIGGSRDGRNTSSLVDVLDVGSNRWIELGTSQRNIRQGRWGHGCCSMGGCVFVIGGYGDSSRLGSVEMVDVRAGGDAGGGSTAWQQLPDMPTARWNLAAVAVESMQSVFALGGWDGNALRVVERYDVWAGRWDASPSPMPTEMSRFGAVSVSMGSGGAGEGGVRDCIVAVKCGEAAMVMDVASNTWRTVQRPGGGSIISKTHMVVVSGGTSGARIMAINEQRRAPAACWGVGVVDVVAAARGAASASPPLRWTRLQQPPMVRSEGAVAGVWM